MLSVIPEISHASQENESCDSDSVSDSEEPGEAPAGDKIELKSKAFVDDNQLVISSEEDAASDKIPAKNGSILIEEKKYAPSMSSLSDSESEEALDVSQEPTIV